jgi:hypothetical protein
MVGWVDGGATMVSFFFLMAVPLLLAPQAIPIVWAHEPSLSTFLQPHPVHP